MCALGAALEGMLSGSGVRSRFAELRLPRGVLPLWAWSIVGLAYYLLFFFVLSSLLGSPPTPGWTPAALVLAGFLLATNAIWNWFFFRKKDLRLSLILFVPYGIAALALALALYRLRSPLFGWYLLYPVYLVYATWWTLAVWRLNRG